jgi:hypothetical protein
MMQVHFVAQDERLVASASEPRIVSAVKDEAPVNGADQALCPSPRWGG